MADILAVSGSPRQNGNCTVLIEQCCKGIQSSALTVETICLHGLDLHPCSACRACKDRDDANCIIDDDMRTIYPKIRAARGLILATPIYWWSVSAQMKIFLDRCDALDGPSGSALRGKRIGVLLPHGGENAELSGAIYAIGLFEQAAAYIGFDLVGVVHGMAWEPGEIRDNESVMSASFELGRSMAQCFA